MNGRNFAVLFLAVSLLFSCGDRGNGHNAEGSWEDDATPTPSASASIERSLAALPPDKLNVDRRNADTFVGISYACKTDADCDWVKAELQQKCYKENYTDRLVACIVPGHFNVPNGSIDMWHCAWNKEIFWGCFGNCETELACSTDGFNYCVLGVDFP